MICLLKYSKCMRGECDGGGADNCCIYLDILSAGIWIDNNLEVMYALATRITFICPMRFNAFPMDIQVG